MDTTPTVERTQGAPRGSVGYVYLISLVAAVGGLLFGYDTAVINGALIFMKEQFALDERQISIAASSLLLGCIIGASVAGVLSDRFGRKWILVLSALLFALTAIGSAVPANIEQFTAIRLVAGIAIGIASMLSPLYIAEVAPAAMRGRLVTLNQFAIISGILASFAVSLLLARLGVESWRWMFGLAAIPSLAFIGALLFVPESPRWLLKQGRDAQALTTLVRVEGEAAGQAELAEIRSTLEQEEGTLAELLRPSLRVALIVGVVLAILQQVTGINTILYFGATLLKEQAGYTGEVEALWANLPIGVVNFIFTVVAIWAVGQFGRKRLLVAGYAGMGISLLLLGMAFRAQQAGGAGNRVIVMLILCYVAFFAVSPGPLTWVLMSEIFPTRIRGRAMSVATVCLWAACFAVSLTFLPLVKYLGPARTFWGYAVMCLVAVVFVTLVPPETKGKSLEEIERMWRDSTGGGAFPVQPDKYPVE